jgi:hypothetical protein
MIVAPLRPAAGGGCSRPTSCTWTLHHLILNELGLGADVVAVRSRLRCVEWCVIVFAGALAISSGLWWLSPRVTWYVGASGVLHSVMAAGVAKHLAAARLGSLDPAGRCAASSRWEQLGGPRRPLVVVDAHLYGAMCGFAVGAALSWRTAIIATVPAPRGPKIMSLAFVFPGQGSQSVGMMSALATESPVIEATFAEASEVLGYDLWRAARRAAELLNATECTQPAMLTAGVATYRLWRERGGAGARLMAGHSLGEFTAWWPPDSLDFKTAVDLVRFRARRCRRRCRRGAAPWPRSWAWRTSTSRRPARRRPRAKSSRRSISMRPGRS